MRLYAWYSPELDVIVLQTIMQDCHICFEWSYNDLSELCEFYDKDEDPIQAHLWMPLGEI